jgi:putative ABC transport system permease protein
VASVDNQLTAGDVSVPPSQPPRPKRFFWRRQRSMNWVAFQMLTGDRSKYFGLVFTIAFSSFLIAQQVSIFVGIMNRTRAQILDVTDSDIWVMDPATQYFDEVYALKDTDLDRVRGVPGVRWAERLFKDTTRAKAVDGKFRVVTVLGVDDATLAGAPEKAKVLLGSVENLREPDAVITDRAGYHFFFPGQPLALGATFELNDRRAKIVGIVDASTPFNSFPIFYARYSDAIRYLGQQRKQMSFVLVKAADPKDIPALCKRIKAATGLQALPSLDFGWMTIRYYIRNTGVPVPFGMTVAIALLVGTVVSGQTFYMFTIENLKQFGALKAIGTTNGRLVGMILLQALLVGLIGYGLGMGMSAEFMKLTGNRDATRGIVLLWQVMAGTGGLVCFIALVASLLSIRKVLVLEPAIVFRG